jgi:hypothetical protein
MTWKRNDPSERSEFCKRRALQQNRKRKAQKKNKLNCATSEIIACKFWFLLQDTSDVLNCDPWLLH